MNYQYVLHKGNKVVTGVGANFKVVKTKREDREEWAAFLTLAKQIPSPDQNSRFDWNDENKKPKHTIKLDLPDLGAFLSLFNNRVPAIKIYHEYEKGGEKIVTQINASPYTSKEGEAKGYSVNVTHKGTKFGFGINFAEAEILTVLFKQAAMNQCESAF